jgi:chemotaxis protein CheX
MLNVPVAAGEPYLEKVRMTPYSGVVALIGLAGNWVGTGIARSDDLTACEIYSRMLTAPAWGIDNQVLDAFGEIANMIVGNFKTSMEAFLGQMGMSIPTVMHGTDFISSNLQAEGLVVPFRWDDRKLEVKVCLLPKEQLQNGRSRGF